MPSALVIDPERLHRNRLRRALTQAELARLAGLTRETVVRYERGALNPRPGTVRSLAAALKVSVEEISHVA